LNSIYTVHDDAKDKEFELELSWIPNETKKHQFVPKDIADECERLAKVFFLFLLLYIFIYLF
jgi:20S proteasome subunit alpha 7